MYLLSMPELLSLSGNLLPLYVESVKELLALLIVKAGEKKAYLKQESELTVVSGVECGCLGGGLVERKVQEQSHGEEKCS